MRSTHPGKHNEIDDNRFEQTLRRYARQQTFPVTVRRSEVRSRIAVSRRPTLGVCNSSTACPPLPPASTGWPQKGGARAADPSPPSVAAGVGRDRAALAGGGDRAGLARGGGPGGADFVFVSTMAPRSLPELQYQAETAPDFPASQASLSQELRSDFDDLQKRLGIDSGEQT